MTLGSSDTPCPFTLPQTRSSLAWQWSALSHLRGESGGFASNVYSLLFVSFSQDISHRALNYTYLYLPLLPEGRKVTASFLGLRPGSAQVLVSFRGYLWKMLHLQLIALTLIFPGVSPCPWSAWVRWADPIPRVRLLGQACPSELPRPLATLIGGGHMNQSKPTEPHSAE